MHIQVAPAPWKTRVPTRRRFCAERFLLFGLLLAWLAFVSACSSNHFQPEAGVDYSLGFFHQVEKGQSLSEISRYYQRNAAILARLNNLGPPYTIYTGQHLYIPPGNDLRILGNPRVDIATIAMVRQRLDRERSAAGSEVPRKYAVRMKHPGDSSRRLARVRPERTKTYPSKATRKVSKKINRPTMAPPRRSPIAWRYPLANYRYVRGYSLTDWKRPHRGVDLAAPAGTPIHAMAGGTILQAGRMGSYGNLVVIDHGGGFSSVYAHNSKNLVRAGEKVKSGKTVALVGSTGRSTGPHLHFEIRYNGKAVNPEKYMAGLKENQSGAQQVAKK